MWLLVSLVAGVLFGAGLTISDMVNPARILNFLDIAGAWDPTLIAVMVGGLAVASVGYRLVFRRGSPLFDIAFHLPSKRNIDPALVGGAGLFGLGWGLAGMCPGPALADLATLNPRVVMFVAAMLMGMLAAAVSRARLAARKAAPPKAALAA